MAYQALYREWRPKNFDDVLGQSAIVKTLRHQIEQGKPAHAYLFCGCRGTGKTTLAKIMARAINCEHPVNGNPCECCDSCKNSIGDNVLDIIEMDAASNSKVEEMRDLLEQVMYPPAVLKKKVYIIDEVHMLSNSAFNALLKTLEEPPDYIVFILATTDPQKIPATILSRLQRYDLGRIPTSLMIPRLRQALDKLNLQAEDEALQIIARSAEGAMRDAFSILDMCVSAADDKVIKAETVRTMLGSSSKEKLSAFFNALAKRDTSEIIRQIDDLLRHGTEPNVFLKDISNHCRNLLTVKSLKENAAELLSITPEEEKNYRSQAQNFSLQRLLNMQELFLSAESTLRYSSFPRVGLESTVLKACETQKGEDNTALTERISELEVELKQLQEIIQNGLVSAQPANQSDPEKAASAESSAEMQSGENSAVLTERISELENELKQLQETIQNGLVPARPASPSAPAKAACPEPPAETKLPASEQDLWKQCMQKALAEAPALASFIKKVRSLGVSDHCLILEAEPNDNATVNYFNRHSEKILKTIREVYGQDISFRISVRGEVLQSSAQKAQAELVDTFGRENVQMIDGETSLP